MTRRLFSRLHPWISLISPVRLVLNGGFGILQMANRDNDLTKIDLKNGVETLWFNLSDPFTPIKEEGGLESSIA